MTTVMMVQCKFSYAFAEHSNTFLHYMEMLFTYQECKLCVLLTFLLFFPFFFHYLSLSLYPLRFF